MTDPATPQQHPRAGDVVKHFGTSETWVVAGVYPNGDILCAGRLCSMARVGEYEVIDRCTDEQHEEMLRQCAEIRPDGPIHHDPRKSLAQEVLRKRAVTLPAPAQESPPRSQPSVEVGDEEYAAMKPLERLMVLRAMRTHETSESSRKFLEGRMLELTYDLDEHPDNFDCGCLCATCRSYGE